MNNKSDEWTLEGALQVLQHPTVESSLWASAVEWLLLYGPPEIKSLLEQASGHAVRQCFPQLAPKGFNDQGEPCYDLADLANSLGISKEEAQTMLAAKEEAHGIQQLFAPTDIKKPQ